MNPVRFLTLLLISLTLCSGTATAQAQPHIDELSYLDKQWMSDQRSRLEDLARRNLGRGFNGNREQDIALLQAILDKQLVNAKQTRELQAMGVVMGDHLAKDLGMDWVVYTDGLGRSRGLRYRDTDNFLFPITMISRRREVGNMTSVEEIYRKAYNLIDAVRTPLPFQ